MNIYIVTLHFGFGNRENVAVFTNIKAAESFMRQHDARSDMEIEQWLADLPLDLLAEPRYAIAVGQGVTTTRVED